MKNNMAEIEIPELKISKEPEILFEFPTGDVRVSADNTGCWHEHNKWSNNGSNLDTKNHNLKMRREWFGGIVLVNGRILALNDSAMDTVELFLSKHSIDTIKNRISNKYGLNTNETKNNIAKLLSSLQ